MLTAIGATGYRLCRNSFSHLLRRPAPRANQGTPPGRRVNALTVQWGDLTKALHENAEFAAIYLRGVHSFHDLDRRFEARALAHFKIVSSKTSKAMYYSRREGILSSELWDEIERTMSDFLAYDGVRQWWETRKHWHTEAFVACRRRDYRQRRQADGLFDIQREQMSRCLNTADERNSRMAANRRCRRRSAVGGYFGGMFARAGAPTVFIGRKHFAGRSEFERSCSR